MANTAKEWRERRMSIPCVVDGCDRPSTRAKGLCPTHYEQQRVGREFTPIRAREPRAGVVCKVDGCLRSTQSRGMCSAHYLRWLQGRSLDAPIQAKVKGRLRAGIDPCIEDDCSDLVSSRDRCARHYAQMMDREFNASSDRPTCDASGCETGRKRGSKWCHRHQHVKSSGGDPDNAPRKRAVKGAGGIDSRGYRRVTPEPGRTVLEHRWLMEQLLGRQLLVHEEVHHCNRVKSDNRTDGPLDAEFRSGNLQLWTGSQPASARVSDMVAWAVELLELYAPELLAAKPVQLRLA